MLNLEWLSNSAIWLIVSGIVCVAVALVIGRSIAAVNSDED